MTTLSSWIAGLMKANSNLVGFIPEPTVQNRYIKKHQLILQHDNLGNKVGFLLHGPVRYAQPVTISQAVIDFDKRWKGYGCVAVNELVNRAVIRNATCVKLRCATNMDAIDFWKTMGFEIVSIDLGENSRKRKVANLIKLLPLQLFKYEAKADVLEE